MKKHSNKLIKRKHKKIDIYAHIEWEKAAKLFHDPPKISSTSKFIPSAKTILHLATAAGVIGIAFAFPGAIPALGALVVGKNKYSRWGTKRVVDQLHKRKFVTVDYSGGGQVTVRITKKGMMRALTYRLEDMKPNVPKQWDKKWRVVIFDIEEKYKKMRELFRMRLNQLGMHHLQDSVYIYPYPIFDEVEFLRELYGIAIKVQYLLVEQIEDDDFLRSRFDLS